MPQTPVVSPEEFAKHLGGTATPAAQSVDPADFAKRLGAAVLPIEDTIRQIAEQEGVDPALALAVAKRESALNPSATGDSGKAIGLFQLHPGAATDTGVTDRADPVQNILGGVRYLKQLSTRYGGDLQKTLMAYNGGPTAVDKGTPSAAAQAYAEAVLADVRGPTRRLPPPVAPVASHAQPTANETGVRSGLHVGLSAGGAMAGAAYGAQVGAVGGPGGALVGGIVGAGAGAILGEGSAIGIEQLAERFGLLPDRPAPRVAAAAREMGSAANTAMMGQVLGETGVAVLTPLARRVIAPMRSRLATYARAALDEFPAESRALLPAEISQSRALSVAENISEGSLLGGGQITGTRATRQQLADRKVADLLQTVGRATSPAEAGAGIQAARTAEVAAFRQAERRVYQRFENLAKDIDAPTPQLTAFIDELAAQRGGILPNAGEMAAHRVAALSAKEGGEEVGTVVIGGRRLPVGTLPETLQAALTPSTQTAEGLTAPELQRTVSDLGKLVGALTRSAKSDPTKYNAQLGLAKKLYGLAREDLDAALGAHPEAKAAYEKATAISRLGNERLFSKPVRAVANVAPERVAQSLLQRNNSTAIKAVEKAVGPRQMQGVRRAAMDSMIPIDQKTGHINWGALAGKLHAVGDDTLTALFPGGQGQRLRDFSRLMLDIEQRPEVGVGRVGIMLTQWGAVAGLMTGTFRGSSAVVLLAPPAMSRIMASPTGLKWLTVGLQAPAGSAEAVKAAVMLTQFLRVQSMEEPALVPSHTPTPTTGR